MSPPGWNAVVRAGECTAPTMDAQEAVNIRSGFEQAGGGGEHDLAGGVECRCEGGGAHGTHEERTECCRHGGEYRLLTPTKTQISPLI
eukprot:CAMPEP_0198705200 /NCGR_PEP_ID=MMETSP1468-20131203/390305_1 /TAXON_ID=1461545 /ORGANISM="Mantoniella sp, Strain CCMP1436" /LENGTH=87 /DNA_ID=CAMNT_0044464057 /DNA_START=902 /DNA_END=1165 /DNA_ORIENTATION=-